MTNQSSLCTLRSPHVNAVGRELPALALVLVLALIRRGSPPGAIGD